MNHTVNKKLEALRAHLEGAELREGQGMSNGANAAVMHAAEVISALKDLSGLFDYRLYGDGSRGYGQENLLTPEQKKLAKDMHREVQKLTDEAKTFQDKIYALRKKIEREKFDDFMHFS